MRGTANGMASSDAADAARPDRDGTLGPTPTGTLTLERDFRDGGELLAPPRPTRRDLRHRRSGTRRDVRHRRSGTRRRGPGGPTADLFPPGARRRPSWRRVLLFATVGVVAVVATVTWTAARGTSSASSSDAVVAAVDRAVAARTADVSIRIVAALPSGTRLEATGAGTVDLRRGTSQSTVDFGPGPMQGQHLGEIFVGNTAHFSVPVLAGLVPGKPWVVEPVSSTALVGARNSDPVATLGLLGSGAGRVVDLGPRHLRGEAVLAYRVTVGPRLLSADLARSHLPASMVGAAAAAMGTTSDVVVVDVDPASGTLRRLVADVGLSVGPDPLVAQMVVDFDAFGRRVTVTPPPSGQELTLSQLQAAAQSSTPRVST